MTPVVDVMTGKVYPASIATVFTQCLILHIFLFFSSHAVCISPKFGMLASITYINFLNIFVEECDVRVVV
jgi:hypothetical protein